MALSAGRGAMVLSAGRGAGQGTGLDVVSSALDAVGTDGRGAGAAMDQQPLSGREVGRAVGPDGAPPPSMLLPLLCALAAVCRRPCPLLCWSAFANPWVPGGFPAVVVRLAGLCLRLLSHPLLPPRPAPLGKWMLGTIVL